MSIWRNRTEQPKAPADQDGPTGNHSPAHSLANSDGAPCGRPVASHRCAAGQKSRRSSEQSSTRTEMGTSSKAAPTAHYNQTTGNDRTLRSSSNLAPARGRAGRPRPGCTAWPGSGRRPPRQIRELDRPKGAGGAFRGNRIATESTGNSDVTKLFEDAATSAPASPTRPCSPAEARLQLTLPFRAGRPVRARRSTRRDRFSQRHEGD
jgi:hypothetical protein